MKVIKINDQKYNIPTSWDDITLRQQIEISMVRNRDEDFRTLFTVSTYTGIEIPLLKRMNVQSFKQILELMTFLSESPKGKAIKSIKFKGEEYLMAESVLRGETQDFLSLESVLKKYKDNQTEALPYVLAVTCKKQGETLDSFDVEARAEAFKDLSYQTAMDVWFFFAQAEIMFSKNLKAFLEVQDKAVEQSLSYTESLMRKQVGLVWYKKLLRTILLLYMRSISKSWKNFYHTSLLKISDRNLKSEFRTR